MIIFENLLKMIEDAAKRCPKCNKKKKGEQNVEKN